jgi:hypothetical protein
MVLAAPAFKSPMSNRIAKTHTSGAATGLSFESLSVDSGADGLGGKQKSFFPIAKVFDSDLKTVNIQTN